MNHLRAILKQAAVYGAAQGLGRGLGLIALPIFTHHLAPAQYGIITLLTTFGAILRVVFGAGATAAAGIVYFRQEDLGYRQTVIWTLLVLIAMGSLAMILAVGALVPATDHYFFGAYQGSGLLFLLFALSLGLQMISEPFLTHLQFSRQAIWYAVISVGGTAVGVVFSIILVAAFNLGVDGWVFGQLAGGVILSIFVVARMAATLGRPRFNREALFALLRAGLPLVPGSIATLIMSQSAPFFVAHFEGVAAVGLFGIGYQFGAGMALATSAISAAWFPFFQSFVNRQDEASALFPKLTTAYVFGFGLLTLCFFTFAKPLIAVMVPAAYLAATEIVGIIALAGMLNGLWGMLLPGIYFSAETALVSLMQMLAAVVVVVLHITLIPKLGIIGAALPLVIGALVMLSLQLFFNRAREYRVRVVELPRFLLELGLLLVSCASIWASWLFVGDFGVSFMFSIVVIVAFVSISFLSGAGRFVRMEMGLVR
jgi:O-antigen/teichoic acid export membrane protein